VICHAALAPYPHRGSPRTMRQGGSGRSCKGSPRASAVAAVFPSSTPRATGWPPAVCTEDLSIERGDGGQIVTARGAHRWGRPSGQDAREPQRTADLAESGALVDGHRSGHAIQVDRPGAPARPSSDSATKQPPASNAKAQANTSRVSLRQPSARVQSAAKSRSSACMARMITPPPFPSGCLGANPGQSVRSSG